MERVESERGERQRLLRIAEQPVVEDLRGLGLDLDSVWQLYKIPYSRPLATPSSSDIWLSTTRTVSWRGSATDCTTARIVPGGPTSEK
jgi:hypothetical protein